MTQVCFMMPYTMPGHWESVLTHIITSPHITTVFQKQLNDIVCIKPNAKRIIQKLRKPVNSLTENSEEIF